MSLFKSKEWWSANLNEIESYDSQCLLVAILGKDRYQSILLGNHDGIFRVYSPTSGMTEAMEVVGYRATDLLLEIQLPSPILQLSLGTLVSGCSDKNLAVLHPKLLTIYALVKTDSDLTLDVVYQHQLRRSAHSFVVGPFGGSRGRDFVCVQSLDGLLSFYEQETFAFQVSLPDFLLPFPFAYIDRIDCFLFLNSSLTFDCYSYENLASAENESSKKIVKYWSYNIGESVLDVRVVASERCNVVVLTERNLYNLGDNGQLIFMKRLEYTPMALYAFPTAESKKLIVIIATDNYLLNIYEDSCLKWSTKVDQIPVSVDRIVLSNLYGGIVLLSENGYLQCIYLGTHPSVYLLPTMNQPEINAVETEAELKRLYAEISEKDIADPAEVDLLNVRLVVESKPTIEENRRVCRLSLEISSQTPVNKIQVSFVTEPPLTTDVKTCLVNCCDKTIVDNCAYLEKPGAVSSLEIIAYLSYVNSNGTPFVLEKRGKLPLSLVLVRTTPTKEAKHKITVVTNKPVCPLNVIFREFVEEDGNPNVLGLKYVNSESTVTVLAAKTTQRYRLQSDALESIGPILSALVERSRKQFHGSIDSNVSYDGTLPLQTLFEEIERYHGLLERRKVARERLSKRTCQYRTIQKKVLVNLKDLTPKPISNLSGILTDTYEMIASSVAELEKMEEELELSRCSVNSLCFLLIALMELMTIAVNDLACLAIVFSGHAYDTDDQMGIRDLAKGDYPSDHSLILSLKGWLEAQLAAATFFLRTTLAKSARDQQKPTEINLNPIGNVSKLSKSFSAVFDRATKGTHLLERSEYEREKEILATIPGITEADEETTETTSILPEGSKLADLKVESGNAVLQGRKEKRLTKQERVDSFGTISGSSSHADEVATETPRKKTEAEAEGMESSKKKKADVEEKSSFDSGEENIDDDDAIWDVKVDEMRI